LYETGNALAVGFPIAGEDKHGLEKDICLKRWLEFNAHVRLAFSSTPYRMWSPWWNRHADEYPSLFLFGLLL
jgi:hypothetical protein